MDRCMARRLTPASSRWVAEEGLRGWGPDVSCADTGAWFGLAKKRPGCCCGAWGGGAGHVFVIAAPWREEPGGVAVGFPGGAQQVEGGIRQRDGAVLGAYPGARGACGARHRGAHVKVERFVEAQSTAIEDGEGDAIVQAS